MEHFSRLFHTRIIEAIRSGEVISLFFPRIGKSLVLDLRHTLEIPPSVMIDDMVSKPVERVERLEELRPTLPTPEEIRIAPWMGSVATLWDTGVADALLERCSETGDSSVVEHCRTALERLERLERQHIRAIVRGEESRTIWQRKPDPR